MLRSTLTPLMAVPLAAILFGCDGTAEISTERDTDATPTDSDALVWQALAEIEGQYHQAWQPAGGAAPARAPLRREPCAAHYPLRAAYFGDLHVHTALSLDAYSRGGFQTPDDAYRFAKGEAIGISPRDEDGNAVRRAQLARPLDFAAVTDHAEFLGEQHACRDTASPSYKTQSCRALRRESGVSPEEAARAEAKLWSGLSRKSGDMCGPDAIWCRAAAKTVWQHTQAAAERHYDRTASCEFTTFHAWEYSRSPASSKVHRNVILRNEIVPELPISWTEEPESEGLWRKLKARCNDTGTGCEAMTIPHNPNISSGRMFTTTYRDRPLRLQRERAALQAELEPLVEMHQSKGESECRQGLYGVIGGEDELCDFEKVRYTKEGDRTPDCEEGIGSGAFEKRGCQSRLDFVRYALVEGLREWQRIGVNPYRLGLIGGTDTHNGTPGATEEFDYFGHNADIDFSLSKRLTTDTYVPHALRNPGGLIGVWAEENSRDALFDAMRRRETFATSGVRIRPRLFGGWDLPPDLCQQQDPVATAYALGVAMGATLPAMAMSAGAPRFHVSAMMDPGTPQHPGSLLQRIQIVKGWLADDGQFVENIIDVAGDVNLNADVDPATCQPTGPGATSLCATWQDPAFDPSRPAVYYARVLENPSCRWHIRQCLDASPSERPEECNDPSLGGRTNWKIQERAWTSPIWYEPTPLRDAILPHTQDRTGSSAPGSTQ